jgi:superfamily II DNA or RNA helicase
MMMRGLFDPPEEPQGFSLADWEEDKADSAGLRYYQRDAAEACYDLLIRGVVPEKAAELNANRTTAGAARSTMIVLFTGGGKTQVFSAIVKEWTAIIRRVDPHSHARVLVLAHRTELVQQARARLEQMTGEHVEVEQADKHASLRARIVVASIDSIKQKRRLERFPRDHFSLIIMDEFHHYISETYRRPADYFETAKLLGVTATPDRGDKKALGMLAESVAFKMDIEDGIDEGFLVPIEGKEVVVDSVDLSHVETTRGGDFHQDQLDDAMLKGMEGICQKLFELVPNEHTVVFTPGVATAHYGAAKLNEYRPGCAAAVDGETPPDVRKRVLADFAAGKLHYVFNCAVLIEGFDAPITNVVARANPTKSRSRYAQEIGRGTRVLPGVIDDVQGRGMEETRKRLIALSAKTKMLVLDFTGNCGEHSLVGPEDILGGKYTDEEIKAAKKRRKETGETDVKKSLDQARRELKALAAMTKAKVEARVIDFDPFNVFAPAEGREQAYRMQNGFKPMSESQFKALSKLGFTGQQLNGKSAHEASVMLAASAKRREKGLASYKQLEHLKRFGVGSKELTAARASQALDYIASCGWKTKSINPQRLNAIVGSGPREPGSDG